MPPVINAMTATWGQIAVAMGHRWIGTDIAPGGTMTVMADELAVAAD